MFLPQLCMSVWPPQVQTNHHMTYEDSATDIVIRLFLSCVIRRKKRKLLALLETQETLLLLYSSHTQSRNTQT